MPRTREQQRWADLRRFCRDQQRVFTALAKQTNDPIAKSTYRAVALHCGVVLYEMARLARQRLTRKAKR